jgi:hypothetical protein
MSTDGRNDALKDQISFQKTSGYYWDAEKLTGKSGFCFGIRHERLGYLLTLHFKSKLEYGNPIANILDASIARN